MENHTNKIYGGFKVIKPSHYSPDAKMWYWHVECLTCNKTYVRHTANFKAGYNMCGECYITDYQPGDQVGRWTVVKRIENIRRQRHYEIKCECGKLSKASGNNLRVGRTTQCRSCSNKNNGRTHGLTDSRIYHSWEFTRNDPRIKRWDSFEVFYRDVGDPPGDNYQLVRPNKSKPWGRSNFKWTTVSKKAHGSAKQNNCSSVHKGVCWNKSNSKWESYISKDKQRYRLGFYDDEDEAARVYNKKARELYGPDAYQNQIIGV